MLLLVVKYGLAKTYGPTQPVVWQPGPAEPAAASPGGRLLPNVVLIVADDLGFNDITRYGG